MTHAFHPERIFDGESWHTDTAIVVDGDVIADLVPPTSLSSEISMMELPGQTIAPGFIDCQVNGGGGVLFNNEPTAEALTRLVDGHRMTGTTSLLPTVISDTPDVHRAAADAVIATRSAGIAEVLGIHIEGPFFALEKRGTHQLDKIRRPEEADINWLKSLKDLITLVTLAPDVVPPETVATLADAGVIVSAGHTNATYAETCAALDAGLRGFTHLYNAMSQLTGREPGVVGAALRDRSSFAGIIADGHHVHPESIALAVAERGVDHIFLVTDAMATVGSASKSFELYGEQITEQEGRLLNSQGVLSGSAIGMIDAVRYVHRVVGLSLADALVMAARTPASFLGVDHRLGRLASGYRADFVVLTESIDIAQTWCAGQCSFDRSTKRGSLS